MNYIFSFIFCSFSLLSFSQGTVDSILIRGIAKYYKNHPIQLFKIDDYISNKESLIESSRVDSNGIFQFKIPNIPTQKVLLRSRRNTAYLYVQPDSEYFFEMPSKNEFEPQRVYGNDIELIFFNLDSTDINYKILSFQNFLDNQFSTFYYTKKSDPKKFGTEFITLLDTINDLYKSDKDVFFRSFIKYTLAELEVVENLRSKKNSYFKYFHNKRIYYKNDAYMAYFNVFYDYLNNSISNVLQTYTFKAIKKASPTLLMNILSKELFLKNVNIRELAMIKMLGDCYNNPEYSKQNIITILDSVSFKSRNSTNRKIASNLIEKLLALYPGQGAPEFNFFKNGDSVNLKSFNGRFLYLHFFNPLESQSVSELEALIQLHKDYGELIHFLTIYPNNLKDETKTKIVLDKINWDKTSIDITNQLWNAYKVELFPMYYLINPNGILIQSPALSPVPNGDYETIHNTFLSIKKFLKGN